MHNIRTARMSETQAVHTIMTACRANEKREAKKIGAWDVTFSKLPNGMYRAKVYAPGSDELAASALVDEFDR